MQVLKWLAPRVLAGVVGVVAALCMVKFWVFIWKHCPAGVALMEWLFR